MSLALVVCLAGQISCRPQGGDDDAVLTDGTREVETFVFPSEQYGSFVGEVQVSSDHLSVSRARPKSGSSGPVASSLVSGPPEGSEVRFGSSLGNSVGSEVNLGTSLGSEVSLGDSPGLSISGATIFFNNPAQVVPITP